MWPRTRPIDVTPSSTVSGAQRAWRSDGRGTGQIRRGLEPAQSTGPVYPAQSTVERQRQLLGGEQAEGGGSTGKVTAVSRKGLLESGEEAE